MAPYRRCANPPTVRVAISRWINPPGRRRLAMTAPDARSPLTVTDADDGEKGPGSASDKLVARYVGKRGSIGVSNSPLPRGTGGRPVCGIRLCRRPGRPPQPPLRGPPVYRPPGSPEQE